MELSQLLNHIRTQYEQLLASSPAHSSAADQPEGTLTQLQDTSPQAQVRRDHQALREARAELAEARKQWHSLQVEIESLHALEKGLERSLQDTQQHYSCQLEDLSRVIHGLEAELGQVRSSIANQRQLHRQLLNTRVKLEQEISTYRSLLEREEDRVHGYHDKVIDLKTEQFNSKLQEKRSDDCVDMVSKPAVEQPTLKNSMRRSPALLQKQKSLVIFTETENSTERKMATVKTQEIVHGNIVQESAEAHGTVETKNIDIVIKQWEGSFFRGNPKLRKKSVSLRFDLHMAAADEGCNQSRQDDLPDVEVRLVMKRSRSIPSITP